MRRFFFVPTASAGTIADTLKGIAPWTGLWIPDLETAYTDEDNMPILQDFSGNANSLTQGISARQEIYDANTLNGLAVARNEDASSDYMTTSAITPNGTITLYALINITGWRFNPSTHFGILVFGNTAETTAYGFVGLRESAASNAQKMTWRTSSGAQKTWNANVSATKTDGWRLFVWQQNGENNTPTVRVNASDVSVSIGYNTGTVNSITETQLCLGSFATSVARSPDMHVALAGLYTGLHTAQQISDIETAIYAWAGL